MSAGRPNEGSIYAAEGTAAHEVGEQCLRTGMDAAEMIDRSVNGFVVDEDMADAVQVYLDLVRGETDILDTMWIEQRVSLAALQPPEPMFGTTDTAIYSPITRRLKVIDYKHGVGVAVDAVDNPQGRFYALGMILAMPPGNPVDEVEIIICQPRAAHALGPIRREVVSVMDLMDWSVDLLAAAELTQKLDAPLAAGDWCKFCPAAGICPQLRDKAMSVAEIAFDDPPALWEPKAPEGMPPDEIARTLRAADILSAWINAVRDHAHREMSAGVEVPGFMLSPKRANREWIETEPEKVAETMAAEFQLDGALLWKDPAIKSPAQIEAVIKSGLKGKKHTPAREAALEHLKKFFTRKSSGTNVVPFDPKRTAVATAADFDAEEFPAS